MQSAKLIRVSSLVLASALALSACSSTDISSPGGAAFADSGGGAAGGTGGGTGGTGGGTTPTPATPCPTGTTQAAAQLMGNTVCELRGSILANLTLPRLPNVLYSLNGTVQVGADIGGDGNRTGGQRTTLTIAPGVTLFGSSGADSLVINRGSRIVADGTLANPIVLTSRNDITQTGNRASAQGEWGGVVILGRAPINSCNAAGVAGGAANCEANVEGLPNNLFGGDQTGDDSGILRFVQVRFPGFEIAPNNELNGITFAGVGSGTVVDRIQVFNSSDDGVELFGGTVNLRFVALIGNDDDSLDWDSGWTGGAQFVLIRTRANSGDNGIEADNRNQANDSLPRSNPRIANMTIVGQNRTSGTASANNGILLRRGTDATIVNTVVTNFSACLNYDDAATLAAAPTFNSTLLGCTPAFRDDTNITAAQVMASFNAGTNNATRATSLVGGIFPGPVELGLTPANPTSLGSFFQQANYVGAFSPTENEANSWASGWTFGIFAAPPCPTGTTEDGTIAGLRRCVVQGIITTDLRLPRGNIYQLNGTVEVGRDIGGDGNRPNGARGSLTVDAGVTVFARNTSDRLVINRGSQIFVNGTQTSPVIFTDFDDVNRQSNPSPDANRRGRWGGIVLLGRAPINNCNAAGVAGGAANCEANVEGLPNSLFGGALPNDNTGRLTFMQVKYAGFEVAPNNELNGITFAGIGTATEVSNIQVHNNADDGVEFFGGGVNIRNLLLTGNDDDNIDWANGWNGSIQFALVIQSQGVGDSAIEADNDPNNNNALPRALGTIVNFTFLGANRGGNQQSSILLRRGTGANLANGIVTGHNTCLDIDDTATAQQNPRFNSVVFSCPGGATLNDGGAVDGAAALTLFQNGGTNNNPNFTLSLTNQFLPGANERAVPVFNVTTLNRPELQAVDFIGAVRDANDTRFQGWTCGIQGSPAC